MILAAQTNPWPILIAAIIGSSGVVLGVLAHDFAPSGKRRWDDELFSAASRFLSEIRRATLLSIELDPKPVSAPRRTTYVTRDDGLAELLLRQNIARELERQIFLLARPEVQRPARLMIRHIYAVIEVVAYGEPDRRAHEFSDVAPIDRLHSETYAFVLAVRKQLRVRNSAEIFKVPEELGLVARSS